MSDRRYLKLEEEARGVSAELTHRYGQDLLALLPPEHHQYLEEFVAGIAYHGMRAIQDYPREIGDPRSKLSHYTLGYLHGLTDASTGAEGEN